MTARPTPLLRNCYPLVALVTAWRLNVPGDGASLANAARALRIGAGCGAAQVTHKPGAVAALGRDERNDP